MKRFARLENDKVVEIIDTDQNIHTLFHKSVADQFVEVEETVEEHDEFDGDKFNKPTPKEEQPANLIPHHTLLDVAKAALKAAEGSKNDLNQIISDMEAR